MLGRVELVVSDVVLQKKACEILETKGDGRLTTQDAGLGDPLGGVRRRAAAAAGRARRRLALGQKAAAVRRAHSQAPPVPHQQARAGQDRPVPQLLPGQRQAAGQEHAPHEMARCFGGGGAALGRGVPVLAARQHHGPVDRQVRLLRPEHLRVHAPSPLVLRGGDLEPGEAPLRVRRRRQQPDPRGPLHAARVVRLARRGLRLPEVCARRRRQGQAVLRLRLQLLPHGQPHGAAGPTVRERPALRGVPQALPQGPVHQRVPRRRPLGQLQGPPRDLAALAVPLGHPRGPAARLQLQGHLPLPQPDNVARGARAFSNGPQEATLQDQCGQPWNE